MRDGAGRVRRWAGWLLLLGTAGCGPATIVEPTAAAPPPDDRPRVVCLGHADVAGGTASLTPGRAGRVVEVGFREGEPVKAGDALVRLDDGDARHEVAAAEAKLRASRARLAEAEQAAKQHPARLTQRRSTLAASVSRLAGARVALKRQQELFDKRLAGQSDVDAAREQVSEFEATVEAARARLAELSGVNPKWPVASAGAEVDGAAVRLAQAQDSLARCVLRAPAAGTVMAVGLHVGEQASPTGPGAIEFCPAGNWLVRAEVEQEFAGEVRPGQPARVRDEMAGLGPWAGQVERVGGAYQRRRTRLDPTGFKDVPTVECVIRLDPGHPALRLGQRLRVSIYADASEVR